MADLIPQSRIETPDHGEMVVCNVYFCICLADLVNIELIERLDLLFCFIFILMVEQFPVSVKLIARF